MPTPIKQKATANNKDVKSKMREVPKKQPVSSSRPISIPSKQKNQSISSATKTTTTVARKRHRVGPRINVSSYVKILATFSEFVKAVKKLFHLDDQEINDELSMIYSSLKDALGTEVLVMQNIKACENKTDQLKRLYQEVEKAKVTAKQLKDQSITLDVPTPDFDYIDRTVHEDMDLIQRIEAQLKDLKKQQKEIGDDFLKNSKDLVIKIKEMLKERNLEMASEEIEHSLINVFSVLRYKLELEDQEKRGNTLNETEKNDLELANLRALEALFSKNKE